MKKTISKKEKREMRIRRSIMRAAKSLFSQKGYKDTTIDEITDKALIAKATLYQYFKSKENLFLETIKDSEENLLSLLDIKVVNNPKLSASKKLKALFYYLVSYFERDYYVIHLMFYRDLQFNDEIIDFIHRFVSNLKSTIQKVLSHFIKDEKKQYNLATSLVGSSYLQILNWNFNGKKESLKDIAKVMYTQFVPYVAKESKIA